MIKENITKWLCLIFVLTGLLTQGQNVGINTSTPTATLHVIDSNATFSSWADCQTIILEGENVGANGLVFDNTTSTGQWLMGEFGSALTGLSLNSDFFISRQSSTGSAPTSFPLIIDAANNVGVGNSAVPINPTHTLEVFSSGSGFTDGLFINGTNTAANSLTNMAFNANGSLVNWRLGSFGPGGANSPESFVITSTTAAQFVLKNNGYLGLGVNDPQAPLHISFLSGSISACSGGYVSSVNGCGYQRLDGNHTNISISTSATESPTQYSILSQGNIACLGLYAFSDKRIKSVESYSDSKSDFDLLKQIEIVNYSFIDKVRYPEQLQKKVIAQQIEEIYPNAVSTTTGFIPSVYALASKFEKTANGDIKVELAKEHGLKVDQILQVFDTENVEYTTEVIEVSSPYEFVIQGFNFIGDEMFIYGPEVKDFRTVDYEALSMLNISATQELAKIVESQNEQIQQQDLEIENLKIALESLLKKVEVFASIEQ